jgi:hypothetical protein
VSLFLSLFYYSTQQQINQMGFLSWMRVVFWVGLAISATMSGMILMHDIRDARERTARQQAVDSLSEMRTDIIELHTLNDEIGAQITQARESLKHSVSKLQNTLQGTDVEATTANGIIDDVINAIAHSHGVKKNEGRADRDL